jgi:Rrf2 family iron-sulfur cluster assembly transcriptional regulator
MRITTKGRYGLRALVHLAMANQERPLSVRDLSNEEGISPEFLEQLFYRLKGAGIIKSTRGPGGGFQLNKKPAQITAKDVFLAVGEEISLTPCTSEDCDLEQCKKTGKCIMEGVWNDASDYINSYFEKLTLADIVKKYSGN